MSTLWRAFLAALFVLATLIYAAAVLTAPRVKADPIGDAAWAWVQNYGSSVCAVLDTHPNADGVNGSWMALVAKGFSRTDADQIIVWSTARYCPEHLALLKRVAAQAQRTQLA